jgi:hypothetical protein
MIKISEKDIISVFEQITSPDRQSAVYAEPLFFIAGYER